MIRKVEEVQLKKLERISPSQYCTAKKCPYKLVLANSYGFKQLMPFSPNAYLGSVLHKIIELISKGTIINEELFDYHWKKEIDKTEAMLKDSGLSTITPLKYFAEGFALKKIKVRNLIKNRVNAHVNRTVSNRKYLTEVILSNTGKTISGVVDLIIEESRMVTIIDFKTGVVFDKCLNEDGVYIVKEDYQYQLKLYCYLYYLKYNLLPSNLYIVTLENSYVNIPFSLIECKAIYDEVICFLDTTNVSIDIQDYAGLAHCSIDNCKYCPYRPACQYYTVWLDYHFEEMKDLKGKLLKVNIFGNNSMGIELKVADKIVLVNGFNQEFYRQMEDKKGQMLYLFNLKKNKHSCNATANNYTIIYA
ncbi:PD-(D/E)XK nuclease family protein [Pedobacter panaciterrae]|uniref:PD-(D/E)XK nuclease family protein n=1 Tax=Pedobacter panaciterrae TaxID=363849 RepID=UPI00259952CC|nr:PD-(D/E)XK nuclease family protein [uncultured Pedobacter sp.]